MIPMEFDEGGGCDVGSGGGEYVLSMLVLFAIPPADGVFPALLGPAGPRPLDPG